MLSYSDFDVQLIWDWYDGPLVFLLIREDKLYYAIWTDVDEVDQNNRIYNIVRSDLMEHFIICMEAERDPDQKINYFTEIAEEEKFFAWLNGNEFYRNYPKSLMISDENKKHQMSRRRCFLGAIRNLVQKELDEGRILGRFSEDDCYAKINHDEKK